MSHPLAPKIIDFCDPQSKMYYVDLTNMTQLHNKSRIIPKPNTINNLYSMFTNVDLDTWIHICAYSLVTHTWTQAIEKSLFTTWTSFTSQLVYKNIPKSIPTTKVHLKLTCENVCSTKPTNPITLPSTVMKYQSGHYSMYKTDWKNYH